jgi:hypothetical protein
MFYAFRAMVLRHCPCLILHSGGSSPYVLLIMVSHFAAFILTPDIDHGE